MKGTAGMLSRDGLRPFFHTKIKIMAREIYTSFSKVEYEVTLNGITVHTGFHKTEAIRAARNVKRHNTNDVVMFSEKTTITKSMVKPVRVHQK